MNKYGMQSYTYLIGWREKDVWYYGSRVANKVLPADDLWKEYFTSSQYVKTFRKENGEPDVVHVHKVFDDTNDAQDYEEKFQRRCSVLKTNRWLNENIFGKPPGGTPAQIASVKGKTQSEETKIKRGIYNPKSEETKKKMSASSIGENNAMFGRFGDQNPNFGRKNSPESIERMKQSQIKSYTRRKDEGIDLTRGPMSEETKQKISISKTGKKHTIEHNQNIGSSRIGKKSSDKTKEKISKSLTGRKMSLEAKAKLSMGARGRKLPPRSIEHSRKISEAHARRKLG